MKKTLLTFGVFLAVACCTLAYAATGQGSSMLSASPIAKVASEEVTTPGVGVSIGTVEAQLYSESGLKLDNFGDAKYVAKTSEGTYMGFSIEDGEELVYDPETGEENSVKRQIANFVAISSSEESVTIPDSIKIGEEHVPVKGIKSYRNLFYGFTNNIKNLTVPATIKSITLEWGFDRYLDAIYMLGAAPVTNNTTINVGAIYVCEKEYLSSYLDSKYYPYESVTPYGWDYDWITVNVKKPGEFAETYLTQNEYDWGVARYVKVTGKINDIDLGNIKKVTNLKKLDLSETSITELPYAFLSNIKFLVEVKLPTTLTKIGNSAFAHSTKLQSVELKAITEIGENAFYNCQSLSYIDLTGAQSIGSMSFSGCSSLNNIDLSTVRTIGTNAFGGCKSLETIDLTSAIRLYDNVFTGCSSLKSVVFGDNLQEFGSATFSSTAIETISIPESITLIANDSFRGCSNLTSVEIPASVTTIGWNAFRYCGKLSNVSLTTGLKSIGDNAFVGCTSLEEITIPSTVNGIGSGAFNNTGIKAFKCYAVIPPTASSSFIGWDMDMTRTFLYVPPFSKDFYRNTQYWSDFHLMSSIEDQIDYLLVDRPLSINLEEEDNAVVANNPKIDLTWGNSVGQLTATGEGTLSAGQLTISGVVSSRYDHYDHKIPTLINYADKMRADNITHNITFSYYRTGVWNFISLPYDVKVSDIIPSDNTYWAIRRYDSAARAAGETSSTWVNLTNDDTLEAGKGYIVSVKRYDNNGRQIDPTLSFTSGNTLSKNNLFRPTDIIVPLTEYPAEFAHNRSWNLIGNPYPCYFDMHYLNEEFTAPVTIWNGARYVAYSPVDDDLVLSPYEAFFVQCPLDATEMTFKEAGRMHSNEGKPLYKAPSRSRETISAEGRNVFNFVLSGENYEDRARIVLNAEAKTEYEIGRDASKFFATNDDNAQIYVNADVAYSINERPINDGVAALGIRSAKEDVYTLALNGKFSDEWHVMLTDNETGITVDLTKESYGFTSSTTENSNRFTIRFMLDGNGQSGIESVIADFGADADVTVTAVNGVVVYTGRLSDVTVPTPGLYLITDGKDTRKAILK